MDNRTGMARRAFALFKGATKRDKFLIILATLGLIGTLLSLAARETFVTKDDSTSYRVALVAPLSGASAEVGRAMREGAAFLVESVNRTGGINGSTIILEAFDDRDDPAEARRIAEQVSARKDIVAVVGHWSAASSGAAAEVYEAKGVPTLIPSAGWPELTKDRSWIFSTVFDAHSESRFLANYARNVIGHKLMSVIHEDTEYGRAMAAGFDETFRRFGAPPQFQWAFDPRPEMRATEMARLVEIYRAKRDEAGALFLAADETTAPDVVKAFRDAGLRAVWFGPNRLAAGAFARAFEGRAAKGEGPANYANGMLVAAPILFDTANEAAQNFRVAYRQRFGAEADWVAAYTHDAMKVVAESLRALKGAPSRQALRDHVAGLSGASGVKGVTGVTSFLDGASPTPVQIGIYNGTSLISALTQLQPIPRGAVSNYIEELKQGRALYVNDRFMYKTNVVYTGIQMKEIAELDLEKETALLEFSIWFRYRGNFAPEDVTFANAAEELKLDSPVDETVSNDMIYRLYRVKGRFNLNFSGAERSYGSHIVGVTFRHRSLNRNNLLYVVDELGMPSGEQLKERLVKDKVVAQGLGWNIDRAWISQEVAAEDALGAPKYVGYGGIAADFSKIDIGIVIKKGGISARDFIPTEWFIYVAIFGGLASIFATAMDAKQWGRFWFVQSFGMRVVFWPLLLLSAGNLVLDYAYQNLALSDVYLAVTTYDSLWWLVPAVLINMAVQRFVWMPIEERTGRRIPNVVKLFATFLIYTLAVLGIVGSVFNQPITSLLATSGLLAMIIGLAIQANISNIFSGIVLNMERPFTVGDWVKIGTAEDARVVDITWRTTRLMTRSGMSVAIPNAKASESQIVNYSVQGKSRITINVYVDTKWPTEYVRKALWDAPLDVHGVLRDPPPAVYFDGIVSADGDWVAQYSVFYWIADYSGKTATAGRVWDAIYSRLQKAGIPLGGLDEDRRLESGLGKLRMGVDGDDDHDDDQRERSPDNDVVQEILERTDDKG